ncbi:MAG: phospholipase D-like domain-containing protein [Microgenomates group bacterium]|jgi:phosphatidylserine/phosphatidylglycerophosphate/cardiolipin synthase-like enzyme
MSNLFPSQLHTEKTFYLSFLDDLESCNEEVIIESPYITSERTSLFIPIFEMLLKKGVRIYVMTRDPKEHDLNLEAQSEETIRTFEIMGVQTLLCVGNHHRKLAILDRKILWEGSLNILSQTHSREIMRRIENEEIAMEMFNFLKLNKFI